MKELGPAAREFVELHRRDSLLPDAARARMKQKLMLRVSTIAATTAIASTAAGMSLASKVVVVALGRERGGGGRVNLDVGVAVASPRARDAHRDIGATGPGNGAAAPRRPRTGQRR